MSHHNRPTVRYLYEFTAIIQQTIGHEQVSATLFILGDAILAQFFRTYSGRVRARSGTSRESKGDYS